METQFADSEDIKNSLKSILKFIGENPDREGLKETPGRMLKSWSELFSGYNQKPEDLLKCFTEGACDEMVILKKIEYYSTCEHHFLPFFGEISIGYIPDGRVVGISKLARLVEIFSRRLQIQERLTSQIANSMETNLHPKGVIVVCTGKHFCMTSRGVEKQKSEMATSAIRGVFKDSDSARNEFLSLISL
jgi:GTP cyclohydrolase I